MESNYVNSSRKQAEAVDNQTFIINKTIDMKKIKLVRGNTIIADENMLKVILDYNTKLFMSNSRIYLKFVSVSNFKWWKPSTWKRKYQFVMTGYGWSL